MVKGLAKLGNCLRHDLPVKCVDVSLFASEKRLLPNDPRIVTGIPLKVMVNAAGKPLTTLSVELPIPTMRSLCMRTMSVRHSGRVCGECQRTNSSKGTYRARLAGRARDALRTLNGARHRVASRVQRMRTPNRKRLGAGRRWEGRNRTTDTWIHDRRASVVSGIADPRFLE